MKKMLFCAELTDFKMILNVLRSIMFQDLAIIRPMEEGLKITLDEMKCIETSIYIPCNIFSNYYVAKNEEVKFKISLKPFTEVLNIFGDDTNPSVKLTYKDVNTPLYLLMKHNEENITVDCEIQTLNLGDFNDLTLSEECNLNKIVVEANIFVELLQRLDNSADEVRFTLSPTAPFFTLTTNGVSGESEVNISKHSEPVTLFQCTELTSGQYNFTNIRLLLKVMHYASKVAISTGESGLLGFQLVINNDDKQIYVEYYITAQFDE